MGRASKKGKAEAPSCKTRNAQECLSNAGRPCRKTATGVQPPPPANFPPTSESLRPFLFGDLTAPATCAAPGQKHRAASRLGAGQTGFADGCQLHSPWAQAGGRGGTCARQMRSKCARLCNGRQDAANRTAAERRNVGTNAYQDSAGVGWPAFFFPPPEPLPNFLPPPPEPPIGNLAVGPAFA